MIHCRSDVPALDSMVQPGGMSLGFCLVRDNFGAKGCQGDLVEVKVAKELVVCRKFWIKSGVSEHVQGYYCLGNE